MTMSEAELWEMFLEAMSVTTSVFSVLLTVNFAYLATAYFVGRRLSGFQALVVSFLYVVGAGILTLSFVGVLNRSLEFAARLKEIDSDLFFVVTPFYAVTFAALLAFSIPVGLIFMYQIRRNPSLGAGST
jgi:hypothetical protein